MKSIFVACLSLIFGCVSTVVSEPKGDQGGFGGEDSFAGVCVATETVCEPERDKLGHVWKYCEDAPNTECVPIDTHLAANVWRCFDLVNQ